MVNCRSHRIRLCPLQGGIVAEYFGELALSVFSRSSAAILRGMQASAILHVEDTSGTGMGKACNPRLTRDLHERRSTCRKRTDVVPEGGRCTDLADPGADAGRPHQCVQP